MSKFDQLDKDKIDNGTLIVCFDINSTREENQAKPDDDNEEIMENPNRIFKTFFNNHKKINVEINKIAPSEINHKFSLKLLEETSFQIRIISDLSFIHEISLNADSYIIFINLEDVQTQEKIEYLIRYILESCCSVDIKTYIIGMYTDKDKIREECKREELENIFSEDNLSYEYFPIKYSDEEKDHFCLYEFIGNKSGDKSFLKKKIEDYHLTEIVEKIINETYENKMGLKFDPFKRKFVDKSEKNLTGDNSGCNIL
jgi:hypothetical protein